MNLNNLSTTHGGYSALRESRRRSSALSSISGRQLSTQTDVTCLDDLEEYDFGEEDDSVDTGCAPVPGSTGSHGITAESTEYTPGAEISVTAGDVAQLWAVQEEDDDVSQISGEIWDFLRRDKHNNTGSGSVGPALPMATLAQADSYSADLESMHSEAELRSCGFMRDIIMNTPSRTSSIEGQSPRRSLADDDDESCDGEVADSLYGIEHVFPVLRFGPDDISSSVASLASSVAAVAAAQHKRVSFRK